MADCVFKGKSYDEIYRMLRGRGLHTLADYLLDWTYIPGKYGLHAPYQFLQKCDIKGYCEIMNIIANNLEKKCEKDPATARLHGDDPDRIRKELRTFSGSQSGTSTTIYLRGDKLNYTWSGNTVKFSDGSVFEVQYNYVLVIKKGSQFDEAVKQIKALTFGKPVLTIKREEYKPSESLQDETPTNEPPIKNPPSDGDNNTMYMMIALAGVIALIFLLKK